MNRSWSRWGLVLLLAVIAIKQVWLAVATPPWEVPDEPAHVSYVQTIVEEHRWPVWDRQQHLSQEIRDSLRHEEQSRRRAHPFYSPNSISSVRNETQPRWNAPPSVQPVNFAAPYAPMYYLYESIPYAFLSSQSLAVRLLGMRLATAVLLLVLVWLSYRIVRSVADPSLALTVAAVVGLHPLTSYIFAGVNNDALAALLGAVVLFFLLKLWQKGQLTWSLTIWIGLAVGLGIANKQHAVIFLPIAVAVCWLVRGTASSGIWWRRVGVMAILAVVIGFSWSVRTALVSPRNFLNDPLLPAPLSFPVTWQFVLEKYVVNRTQFAVGTFWGIAGWNGSLAHWRWEVYGYAALGGLAATGHVMYLLSRRRFATSEPGLHRLLWLSFSSAVVLEVLFAYLYGKTAWRYHLFHFPSHGRYYLLVFLPLAIIFTTGLSHFWQPRWRPIIYGAIILMMLIMSFAMIPLVHQLPGLRS